MQDYLIERHIPGVGQLDADQLRTASAASNAALAQLAGIEWVASFVTQDSTFCHYRAESEEVVREHARISGFPATRIVAIGGMIGPATGAGSC